MSAEVHKEFIGRYLTALSGNAKPRDLIAQYVEDQELEHHIAIFEEAFPNYELTPDVIVAEGDKVAVRATFQGIQQGAFQGVPASGRNVTTTVMIIYRIANGRIVEHWMNADSLSLLQQIGAIPEAEVSTA